MALSDSDIPTDREGAWRQIDEARERRRMKCQELKDAGFSNVAIAARLGVNESSVRAALKGR